MPEFNPTKYKNEFNKKNYKQLKADIKPDDYNLIDTYSKKHNISKARLIVESIKYCIKNGIFEDQENKNGDND